MRILTALSRLSSAAKVSLWLRPALMLLLAAAGLVLLGDRHGLRADYFALGAPWKGSPRATTTAAPALDDVSEVGEMLMTKAVFSIRWSGWWHVEREGEHRFFVAANDGGYLKIDGDPVLSATGASGTRKAAGSRTLKPGFHAIDIGHYQNFGESHLTVHWAAPGQADTDATILPVAELYSGRPLLVRQVLRRAVGSWPRARRQLLGALLLLLALALLGTYADTVERATIWLAARLPASDGSGFRATLLCALFVVTFLAVLPFTGTVRGGDDTSYLDTATFNTKKWYISRYCHIYLMKLFTTLSGGDPLLGVRVWWSFVFAATVAALAVAVRSVGPGLQLRTLAATLFVLLAQTGPLGLIGGGFADFSAMMFVTLAVAICLHGLTLARGSPPPRHEWHALAVGALTVGAFRSKEVGAVLLLLPLLFLIGENRSFDVRRFARRLAYWTAGAIAVQLSLFLLDGLFLGEFFFSINSHGLAASSEMNFPSQVSLRKSDWFNNLSESGMRSLWLGVVAAAIAAGVRRRRLELRLLHLLPIAYLAGLIAIYIRLPHPFSNRMLISILPVACLMTGLLLHYAGLDDLPWKQLLGPQILLSGGAVAAVICLLVIPYQLGTLDLDSVLPAERLLRYGWTPDHFVVGVLLPLAALLAFAGVALFSAMQTGRVVALALVFLTLFGPGFAVTRESLSRHWAAQKGDLLLYPWRVFRDQLAESTPHTVVLSPDLERHYQMSATTRSSIARLALHRPSIRVTRSSFETADAAIASIYSYRDWLTEVPALAATASFDPAGFLVLVRPKLAAREQGQLESFPTRSGEEPKSVEELLDILRQDRDPEDRERRIQWLVDSAYGPSGDRSLASGQLQGRHLRALGLSPDGWTRGDAPAGLIVDNRGPKPYVQKLSLSVSARPPDYPIRVFVDDGEREETVLFEQATTHTIELSPVPPRSRRLFIVWSDKAWIPGGGDWRPLGVLLASPPAP